MAYMAPQTWNAPSIISTWDSYFQSIEMADKEDIRASIDLLKFCIEALDTYDWSFKVNGL